MAEESPLGIYRDVLRRSRAMPGELRLAADEERTAYDTSMGDIEQSYSKRDPGGPLYAMASGLLANTRPGSFGRSWGAGLEAYRTASNEDADKEVERAQKIAALRQARAALSRRTIAEEAGLFGTQTSAASGMNTLQRQALEDQRRREEDANWQRTLRLLGGGGGGDPIPPPPVGGPAGGIENDDLGAGFGMGGDGLAGGAGGDVLVGGEGTPQMSGGEGGDIQLTQNQRLILQSAPRDQRASLLQTMLRQNQTEMSPEGKKARDLGYKPGTPEFSEVVKKLLAGEFKPQGSSDTAEQRAKLAESMNLPPLPIDPTAGLTPGNSERLRLQLMKEAEKAAAEADEGAKNAKAQNDGMDRFLRLNKQNDRTGPIWGRLPNFSQEAQEMESISADMARNQRQPGEGAVSDFDAQQFRRIVPSTSLDLEVNQQIIEARKAANEMTIQRAEFLRAYQTAYGHLHGAENAWKTYANENPIFSRDGSGILNRSRVDWRTYFSQRRTAGNGPQQPQGSSVIDRADAIIRGK